jgi:AraC-like DNA-binding protein
MLAPPLIDHGCFERLSRSRDFLASQTHLAVRIPEAASVAGISSHHYVRLYARAFHESFCRVL